MEAVCYAKGGLSHAPHNQRKSARVKHPSQRLHHDERASALKGLKELPGRCVGVAFIVMRYGDGSAASALLHSSRPDLRAAAPGVGLLASLLLPVLETQVPAQSMRREGGDGETRPGEAAVCHPAPT